MVAFNIWNFLTKAMDAFVITFVPFRVLKVKPEIRNENLFYALILCFSAVVFYGIDFLFARPDIWITLVIYAVYSMIYMILFYKGHVSIKSVLTGGVVSVSVISHYLTGCVFGCFRQSFQLWSAQATIVSAFFLIIATIYFIHFAYIPNMELPRRYGTGTAIYMLLVVLCVSLLALNEEYVSNYYVNLGLYTFAITSICFLYYLFFQMLREYERKNIYKLTSLSLMDQKKNIKESVEVYNQIRMLRHELKNQVFYMRTLLDQGRMEELRHYFDELYKRETKFSVVGSGNTILDSLLNQKKAFADSKNIVLESMIALPKEMSIKDSDLCTIVANLLDNAIEACDGIKDSHISLTMQKMEGYIHIQCKNTILRDVLQDNPTLHTTKQGDCHGLGLQIIRELVEKYQGMIEIKTENHCFIVNLMMCVCI